MLVMHQDGSKRTGQEQVKLGAIIFCLLFLTLWVNILDVVIPDNIAWKLFF